MKTNLNHFIKTAPRSHDGNLLPRITCNDGFSMSVQAGVYHYSEPRTPLEEGLPYEKVEVGFPSKRPKYISCYAESGLDDKVHYTDTVYPFVPTELVEKLIDFHGGIKDED